MSGGTIIENRTVEALLSDGSLIGYFGYGSLVNRATLRTNIVGAARARLAGWRREWQGRPAGAPRDPNGRDVALLTARRSIGSAIDGLLVLDHRHNLPAVDEREAGYRRVDISLGDFEHLETSLPDDFPIYVYEADAPLPGTEGVPILNSYLDAVLQGFLVEHGATGFDAFLDETVGFDRPIIADRRAPLYPRAVSLSHAEQTLIDQRLALKGLRLIDLG